MVWQLAAAGVSAAASLLGGRKAKKEARRAEAFQRQQVAEQNAYNAPDAIRARAEEAGFNPLLFVGPGVGLQGSIAAPVLAGMGDAIANAGLAVANGLSEYGKQHAYATALEQQNAELRKAVETATLRPEMPGIYGTSQPLKVGRAPSAEGLAFAAMKALEATATPEIPVESKWIKIWDELSKSYTYFPNPDLMDAGPSEMATGMATIAAAESAQHGRPGGFDLMFDRQPHGWVSYKKPGSSQTRIPRIEVRP